MIKQLTIVIPSYNSEAFLGKCLESMCGVDERVEIIVVNDGSKDRTSDIAHNFEKRYPLEVRVIDKENGGHGSGINAGLDAATGRYYKVVDSDDWILNNNLKKILDKLERADVDAFIMGYETVNISNEVISEYIPVSTCNDRQIDIIKLADKYDDVKQCLNFHSICYKTDFLRKTGIRMSEHTFYEDQEFAILPFMHVNSIIVIPEILYVYRIGDSNQSVSLKNQARLVGNHNQVVKKMIDYFVNCKPMGKARTEFQKKRLFSAIVSNYAAFLVKSNDRKEGRKQAEKFRLFLYEKDAVLAKATDKRYFLLKKLSYFDYSVKLYEKILNSKLYAKIMNIWL